MKLNYRRLPGGFAPSRAHKHDAGFDVYASSDFTVKGNTFSFQMLSVCISIPQGYVGLILGRSSLSKSGLNVYTGVIDSGYIGELGLAIFNASSEDYSVMKGDRIAQIVLCRIADITDVKECEKLVSCSSRGTGGFGSTGR